MLSNTMLHHAVDYTPYESMRLSAWPGMTISRGNIVWDGRPRAGRAADGSCIAPRRPSCRAGSKRPEMKLLVINPNISKCVTALIETEACCNASPGTALTMKTAPFGVAYIETRFEVMISAYATAQVPTMPEYAKRIATTTRSMGTMSAPLRA